MNETHFAINTFIALLLIASGVAMAAKWVRVPYTLMLVIVGIIISPMHFLPTIHMSPDLILLIFLPALLFEAAWNLKLQSLRANMLPILMLASVGVGISVGIMGLVLHFGTGLGWAPALLFGAMISATDPVSVLAIFKKLGLPIRLTTILEGESLFNDGTAVVVFRIILGIFVGTASETGGALVWNSFISFCFVVAGGIAAGAVVGLLSSTLTSHFDDHLLEISLTAIAAYGSFLLAEWIHVSPVIAVLVTGLIIGNYGRRIGMSATTQVAVNSFWEYAAFVVNSLVFLLIGLEIQIPMLFENATAIAWALLGMLVARAVSIYGLMPGMKRWMDSVPFRWQHVLFWGGLRGSLSIALVLSLPTALPGRSQLVVMIFGAVIFSLLVQGLTISPLLRGLRFSRPPAQLKAYELLQGSLLAETAGLAELEALHNRGVIEIRVFEALRAKLTESHQDLRARLDGIDPAGSILEKEQMRRVLQRVIHVKKARLTELQREGLLSEASVHELNQSFDQELAVLRAESDTPTERSGCP